MRASLNLSGLLKKVIGMLTLKNGCVLTLTGHMLWADDWTPSKVIVGHYLTDEQLGPAIGCRIVDGIVFSCGEAVARIIRDDEQIIKDLLPYKTMVK